MSESAPSRPVHEFVRDVRLSSNGAPDILQSYCAVCGAFVAASPSLKLILIAEALHCCRE